MWFWFDSRRWSLLLEPTSVLDLCSSPTSIIPGIPDIFMNEHPSSFLPIDKWDSMLRALRENDDSAPTLNTIIIPQFETLNPNLLSPFYPSDPQLYLSDLNADLLSFHPVSERFDLSSQSHDLQYLEQLIQMAECVESNEILLANLILPRLNHHILSPPSENHSSKPPFASKRENGMARMTMARAFFVFSP